MNAIIDWIVHQISTQWIAIITAIAGFVVWKTEHTKLIFEPDDEADPVAGILLDDGRSILNQEHSMQRLSMWMVNPSSNDVSFFDLRIILNNGEADYYTSVKFNHFNGLEGTKPEALIPFEDGEQSNRIIGIAMPQAKYGTVPAHGFAQIDLVFHADEPCDDAMVLMKLAQPHNLLGRIRHSRKAPKWLRPKMGYIFSETKEISRSFHVKEVRKLKLPEQFDSGK